MGMLFMLRYFHILFHIGVKYFKNQGLFLGKHNIRKLLENVIELIYWHFIEKTK